MRGHLKDMPRFGEVGLRAQMMMVCHHFGYGLKQVAEGFGCEVGEVKETLELVDPDGKVRVGIGEKISRWNRVRRLAEEALTPEKFAEEGASGLMKMAAAAELRVEQLSEQAEKRVKKLSEGELSDRVKMLAEGLKHGDGEQDTEPGSDDEPIGMDASL